MAADTLVEACVHDPRRSLQLVYPILFSYRHAIEIALKFIIDFYDDASVPRTHDLSALWLRVRRLLARHCQAPGSELDDVARILGELSAADPQSTSFRYAWPRRSRTALCATCQDRPDIPIDLATVRSTMGKVRRFFDEMDGELMTCGFDLRD